MLDDLLLLPEPDFLIRSVLHFSLPRCAAQLVSRGVSEMSHVSHGQLMFQ